MRGKISEILPGLYFANLQKHSSDVSHCFYFRFSFCFLLYDSEDRNCIGIASYDLRLSCLEKILKEENVRERKEHSVLKY